MSSLSSSYCNGVFRICKPDVCSLRCLWTDKILLLPSLDAGGENVLFNFPLKHPCLSRMLNHSLSCTSTSLWATIRTKNVLAGVTSAGAPSRSGSLSFHSALSDSPDPPPLLEKAPKETKFIIRVNVVAALAPPATAMMITFLPLSLSLSQKMRPTAFSSQQGIHVPPWRRVALTPSSSSLFSSSSSVTSPSARKQSKKKLQYPIFLYISSFRYETFAKPISTFPELISETVVKREEKRKKEKKRREKEFFL